ncbi:hypothetical protein AAFF_G00307090 [Aldrovandia affinis]|uniref:Uncharacterized protein n=1 Tax=Aldrovandia affinis TaxID=143900 RepID=A0AAD7RAH5_9TELE|nr:hypothetical protein AAFF_G00307090 [Aldrovandia affinis]
MPAVQLSPLHNDYILSAYPARTNLVQSKRDCEERGTGRRGGSLSDPLRGPAFSEDQGPREPSKTLCRLTECWDGGEHEERPTKSVRQIRRPDSHASRKAEEVRCKQEPPSPQHVGAPKPVQRETGRAMSVRRALSIQNLSQMESPWDGVTLNRCLFVAITILLISSGFQRLHEALKALRAGEEDGPGAGDGLALRRVGLKQDRAPPQPERSLWGSLFWWVLEDDDDDDEEGDEESPVGKTRTEDGSCGGSGRVKQQQDTPGRAGRAREKRRKKMGRGREQEEEEEEGKRGREKRAAVRQREEGEGEEEEGKEDSEPREGQKGSEVTVENEGKSGGQRSLLRSSLYDNTFERRG